MQVHYTIHGLEPRAQSVAAADAGPSPFQLRLEQMGPSSPVTWRSLLNLDAVPETTVPLGPPDAPPSIDFRDAIEDRRRWRVALGHLAQSFSSGAAAADPRVRNMLAVLAHFQDLDDEISARGGLGASR